MKCYLYFKMNKMLLFIVNITFCNSIIMKESQTPDLDFDYSNVTRPPTARIFYFLQRLNHFQPSDRRQWFQRYAVTVDFYKKSGPAFLYVNGASPIDDGDEFSYHVTAYAKHLNAIVFSLELRFYGKEYPLNGSIVQHLSSSQTLADIANFIKGIPKEFHLPKNLKWILFGCSHGGRIAAWARLKYPHLIHGAVVSSAPLLSKVDYYEYEQIVEESLKSYDPKCIETIMVGFDEIANAEASSQNRKIILKMLDLNDDIREDYDFNFIKEYVLYLMLSIIRDAVQNNDTNYVSIPVVCRIITDYNNTKLEAFVEIKKIYQVEKRIRDKRMLISGKSQNVQNYADDPKRGRYDAWKYQRCTEIGHFTSWRNVTFISHVKELLTPIEQAIEATCYKFFGSKYGIQNLTERINYINSQYGGLDYNMHNVIFIHGSVDPWYKAGIYQRSNASLYETIFIKGTSHCADTNDPLHDDIPELRKARNKVFKTLYHWLNTDSASTSSRN